MSRGHPIEHLKVLNSKNPKLTKDKKLRRPGRTKLLHHSIQHEQPHRRYVHIFQIRQNPKNVGLWGKISKSLHARKFTLRS
jgi:hypothetical protein